MRAAFPLAAALSGLLLSGCAGMPDYMGRFMESAGLTSGGAHARQAAVEPDAARGAVSLQDNDAAAKQLLASANRELAARRPDAALALYRQALTLNPGDAQAREGIEQAKAEQRHAAWRREAAVAMEGGDLLKAGERLRSVLAESPADREALAMKQDLDARRNARDAAAQIEQLLAHPVTLQFRNAEVKVIARALQQASGIDFVLDRDVNPAATATLSLRDAPVDAALQEMLKQTGLAQKVLGAHAIALYPDTVEKRLAYKDRVMHTFYLTNAHARDVAQMLQSVLKVRDLYTDERLNLVILRADTDTVRLAEQMVRNVDQPPPEVMLEMTVLAMNRGDLQKLGVQLPDLATLNVQTPGQTDPSSRHFINFGAPGERVIRGLKSQAGDAGVVARSQVRLNANQRVRIRLDSKAPGADANAQAAAAAAIAAGLLLEIEPRVYLNNDVAMQVKLDATRPAAAPGPAPAAREGHTEFRLKEGDTEMLVELLPARGGDGAGAAKGFSGLPVIGRLFDQTPDPESLDAIVILLTPRVLHNLALNDDELETPAPTTAGTAGSDSARISVVSAPAVPAALDAAPGKNQPAPPAAGSPR